MEQNQEKQPSAFKQEWEAKKLLKRAKKKAKQSLEKRGHSRSEASSMVKQAIRNIAANNRPERKSAGRGG